MFARKRFGQHFLHDPRIIERIVSVIAPERGQSVVEIGPGLGALTFPLLARLGELEVIEIDRDAIRALKAKTDGAKTDGGALRIHEGDVLKFDLRQLAPGGRKLRLVGNLPYNISTPLLFHLLKQREVIEDMHFMLQKEVVDRMAAGANDDSYGRLSVMLAPWAEVTALFDVGPGAFRPPPRVTSSIVRLRPYAEPPFVIANHDAYARVVRAAFAQRRKTLRNALKQLLDSQAIESCGIDPGARAETISPPLYALLAERLATKNPAVL